MHKLLEQTTQCKLVHTSSTGDAEECKREPEAVIFASALFALLVMLLWPLIVEV